MHIALRILPDEFSLYQLPKDSKLPHQLLDLPWYTISKTASEISLVLPSGVDTHNALQSAKSEGGWRGLQVDAQMEFGLVGILASIIDPLRDNQIPVFVVSTYDTDYVFIKDTVLEKAIGVLSSTKNIVLKPGKSVLEI
ncbi:ACT domain-containing protein [Radiomyces spectabilis]|uniref:ACT domain-containing protein n=1 Tax=Radiomyces spectabilis TaxID=64574 RepID=UPI0022207480|nr:ACT domain-containing protein [Radiomyces spectabilis]KAI8364790.1 ACT domain-containing protein [Radiomyces spectabilis]